MSKQNTPGMWTTSDYLIAWAALSVRTLLTTWVVLKMMTWMGFVLIIGTLPRPAAPLADPGLVVRR